MLNYDPNSNLLQLSSAGLLGGIDDITTGDNDLVIGGAAADTIDPGATTMLFWVTMARSRDPLPTS